MDNIIVNLPQVLKMFKGLMQLKKEKAQSNHVMLSRKIEDKIYDSLQLKDEELRLLLANASQESFKYLTRDVFQCFYSLKPEYRGENELSVLALTQNKPIIEKLFKSDTYPSIKSICEGKALQAGEATKNFVKSVLENAENSPQNKLEQVLDNQSNILQKLLQDLEICKDNHDKLPNKDNEKRLIQSANKAANRVKQINELSQRIKNNKAAGASVMSANIQNAMSLALEQAELANAVISAWGDNIAEETSFEISQELLQKVRQDKKLLEIAKYLGPYKEMLKTKRKNAFTYGRGEKYTLEQGNNISNVIGAEFAMLSTPETTPIFVRKYQQKQLKQYKKREKSDKALGDIVICLDESSSMRANGKEAWSKALAAVLAEATISRGRTAAIIHFSSKSDCKSDIITKENATPKSMMSLMHSFIGGGTDYETPLLEALRLIEIKAITNADIVFVTDGECAISDCFAKVFAAHKAALRFKVTGILLDDDGIFNFSLRPFCDEIYKTSSSGRDGIVSQILI